MGWDQWEHLPGLLLPYSCVTPGLLLPYSCITPALLLVYAMGKECHRVGCHHCRDSGHVVSAVQDEISENLHLVYS